MTAATSIRSAPSVLKEVLELRSCYKESTGPALLCALAEIKPCLEGFTCHFVLFRRPLELHLLQGFFFSPLLMLLTLENEPWIWLAVVKSPSLKLDVLVNFQKADSPATACVVMFCQIYFKVCKVPFFDNLQVEEFLGKIARSIKEKKNIFLVTYGLKADGKLDSLRSVRSTPNMPLL